MADGYVRFITYRVRKGVVIGERDVRVYDSVGGVGGVSGYLPFVTPVTLENSEGEGEYYELRNGDGQVIYITDSRGIATIYQRRELM
jgi:hypothetical protein